MFLMAKEYHFDTMNAVASKLTQMHADARSHKVNKNHQRQIDDFQKKEYINIINYSLKESLLI